MNFTQAVTTCFQKYVDFNGRARRSEYWYWSLFTGLISAILSLILGSESFIVTIFSLATLLPGLAVSVRRLHDIGKSGWWLLIALIPLVGAILLLIWDCKDSDPGTNVYGSNPKA